MDPHACRTLRVNRPEWDVIQEDVHHFKGVDYRGVDLLAGGVPCPPFSIAGKQLGADDERDLFPQALRLVEECEPTAVMLENVRGLPTARFARYRQQVLARLPGPGHAPQGAAPGRAPQLPHTPGVPVGWGAGLQVVPRGWLIAGQNPAGARQVGNAFPPPGAQAVGRSIRSAIEISRPAARPARLLGEASSRL